MDEKTSNQMINLLVSIERKLSSIAKVLKEKSKSK
jgi:hypothetical protein